MAGVMKQEVSFFFSLKVWMKARSSWFFFKQQQSGSHLGHGGILGTCDIAEREGSLPGSQQITFLIKGTQNMPILQVESAGQMLWETSNPSNNKPYAFQGFITKNYYLELHLEVNWHLVQLLKQKCNTDLLRHAHCSCCCIMDQSKFLSDF